MLRLVVFLALVLVPLAATAGDDFSLQTEGPSLNGKWQFRSFTISSEGSDTWGQPYEGHDTLEILEQADGRFTGTMVLHGNTFPIEGTVDYGEDRVLVTWSGQHKNEELTIRRVFYAYMLPLFANADEQVEMMAGTEGITVMGDSFGGSSSFVAVPAEF
jgi:hypothetical protein